MREGRTEHYAEILDEVARQSSVCERRADEAERESDKLKKAEYMSYHLGEEFEELSQALPDGGLRRTPKYSRRSGTCQHSAG